MKNGEFPKILEHSPKIFFKTSIRSVYKKNEVYLPPPKLGLQIYKRISFNRHY